MWIMVAHPYSAGGAGTAAREANLLAMNTAAYALFEIGHLPLIGVNLALPLIAAAGADRDQAVMMPLSLALAERCDAILRIGGPSSGADAEVEVFRARALPVYYALADVPPADPSG